MNKRRTHLRFARNFQRSILTVTIALAVSPITPGFADGENPTPEAIAPLSTPFPLGLHCPAGGLCEIGLAPTLKLKAPLSSVTDPGNPHRIELKGEVTIVTPSMELPLAESTLVVAIDPTGNHPSELYGTARAPMERLPILKDANLETVPSMTVGLVQAATITELLGEDVPLNSAVAEGGSRRTSTRPYFLFHVDQGLSMGVDLGKDAKAGTSLSVKIPGTRSATFILDSVDPYFFLTQGLSLTMPDQKEGIYEQYLVVSFEQYDAGGNLETTFHEHYAPDGRLVYKYAINASTGRMIEQHHDETGHVTVTFFELNGKGDYRQEGSDGRNGRFLSTAEVTEGRRSKIKKKDSDPEHDEKKEDSDLPIEAFGYSYHGWIPYEAKTDWGIPEDSRNFSGQLYLQGEIPFGKFVSLDGHAVTYIGAEGFAQGGNGMLALGLPGIDKYIDFSLELGNASAALVVTGDSQMTYVSGELEPDTLFFDDILPIFPSAGARVSGYIDNKLADAHIAIEGEMGLGADTLGSWIGVDLTKLQMTAATATLDTQGIFVSGTTKAQIHPSIALSSEVRVEASIDWADPLRASLTMIGDMDVFGVGLKDVTLSLSQRGMFINGAFVTPLSRIAMAGSISGTGPSLTGSASVVFPLGSISQRMRDAAAALESAQAEVKRLKSLVRHTRGIVEGERRKAEADLRFAEQAVGSAQGTVNSLNSQISYEHSVIAKRRREIASWARWRRAASWWQSAYRAGRYAYEAGWRSADIGRRYVTIGALEASKAVAHVALAAAREALKLAGAAVVTIPVDADPRLVTLIASKEVALVALEAAKLPLKNVPLITGDFRGEIKAGLDYRGIQGVVSAKFKGYRLLRGNLRFGISPSACVTLPGLGEACVAI